MRSRNSWTRSVLAWWGAAILALAPIPAIAAPPKRVLILNPFGRDVEPFSSAVSSFRSTLAREMGAPVDFHEIPLELARFTGPEGEAPLVAFLEDRIKDHPVDLVVPVGGAGVQFAARYRDRLFTTTPVLALAAEPRTIPPDFLSENATLVTQEVDLAGMVEDVLQMQPQTKRIAVVFGASALEKFWVDECRRAFVPFADRVEFLWLNDLPLEQVVERCAELPPNTFIMHLLFVVDAAGMPSERNEALRKLHTSANAPVFAYFESEFGLGPIGGRLFQNTKLGVEGGRVARRILRGENPASIPAQVLEAATPVYDWRELKRWGIKESRLPAGSKVEFRQPGFLELYRWQVLGAGLFGVLQAFLIVGLLANRSKRRQGEREAALLADISSKFVNLPSHQVDDEILEAQRRVCALLEIDLSVLWQWSERRAGAFMATHVFSLQHGPQPPFPMKDDDFPWVRQEILAGRIVAHRSLDELPAEADKDRDSARQAGIKSHLTLPLVVGGEPPLGIFGLNTTRAERHWPKSLVERMQLVAQIFANALARKRADENRRESELRLSLAMDSAEAGLWVLDWDSQTFLVNEKARAMFGYASDEPVTMARFKALVHPDDWSLVHHSIRGATDAGHPVDVEYRIRLREEGSERWIVSRGRPDFRSPGEVERLLGLSMDITERKRAETRLHQLSLAVEQSPVLVVITDISGKIVYVNQKFSEVSGYSLSDCLGKTPRILKSGHSPISRYKELWSRILNGETWSGEFHNRRKNGELYWERAIISPLLDAEGRITHFVGIKEDITEEKRSVEALRTSEELNRVTFEQAAIGIAHLATNGRWLRVNDRLCEIVGYAREELTELTLGDVTFPEDLEQQPELNRKVLSGEIDTYAMEQRYLRKDGAPVWVNLNVSLLRGVNGEAVHFIAVVEDITEQRRAETEARELRGNLAHAGRVTLLGQLASSLAHELSQPLGAILRNAEAAEIMLRDASPDLEEIRAIVDDILKDDQRAGLVIDRLRTLLKRRRIETQPVTLPAVVNEVLSLVRTDATSRHVGFVLSPEPNLPMVSGDRIQLQQVVLNLLVNAMDAMEDCDPENRRIEVAMRQADAAFVEVRVSDAGPGIPAESLDRLFEPFFTSKAKGMGVGLSVSQTIIEAHRGKLWAENGVEGGACFCFTVPVWGGER
jgi:nitrogen fixation negative regulator NifL